MRQVVHIRVDRSVAMAAPSIPHRGTRIKLRTMFNNAPAIRIKVFSFWRPDIFSKWPDGSEAAISNSEMLRMERTKNASL